MKAQNVLKQLLEMDVSAVLAKQMENFGHDEESEEAKFERYRHLRLEEASDPGFWMRQHHHEEDPMSDVETPFEKRIVTLIYKRKFSKVPFEKADAPLRKSFSESLF